MFREQCLAGLSGLLALAHSTRVLFSLVRRVSARLYAVTLIQVLNPSSLELFGLLALISSSLSSIFAVQECSTEAVYEIRIWP